MVLLHYNGMAVERIHNIATLLLQLQIVQMFTIAALEYQ